MSTYKIDRPGDTISEAITQALALRNSVETLEGENIQHRNAIQGHSAAIHDLQMDVAALKISGGSGVSIQAMSQSAYDALETKDANTIYLTY